MERLQSPTSTCVRPEDLERERASVRQAILVGRLAEALERLSPWLSETKAVKAAMQIRAARLAEANRAIYP